MAAGNEALAVSTAVGGFLTSLGPGLISNLFQKSADARKAAEDFARNHVLAGAFGRAVGLEVSLVAAEAEAAGEIKRTPGCCARWLVNEAIEGSNWKMPARRNWGRWTARAWQKYSARRWRTILVSI
ncbi:MAG: hypothetical protein R3F19_21470 [Verrucomicrobiales bacterium]